MKKPDAKNKDSVRIANEAAPMKAGDFSRLEIPYGDYPHRNGDGVTPQRLTKSGAQAICKALANAVSSGKSKGLPIYHGHPDVPELAAKYPDKRAHGWAASGKAETDRLVFFPVWNEEPGNHFSHISPYWFVQLPAGDVFAIQSIALVNHPMIPDLRLPNEDPEGTPDQPGPDEDTMKPTPKLLQLLGLPNEADAAAVETAVEALTTKLANSETKVAALANEKQVAETGLANERAARVAERLDTAVTDGTITHAARPAWQQRLEADYAAGCVALANENPAVKTKSVLGDTKKPDATHADVIALANERATKKGIPMRDAYAEIKKEKPELFKQG